MKTPLGDFSGKDWQGVVLTVLSVIFAAILVTMWLIFPAFAKKRTLVKTYLEKSEQLKKDEREILKKSKVETSVEKLKAQAQLFKEKIPGQSGKFSILQILNEKAQEAQIGFDQIDPREIPEKERIAVASVTQKEYVLTFQAGYHAIGTFVNRVENASPFISVQDIKIFGDKTHPNVSQAVITVRCLLGG